MFLIIFAVQLSRILSIFSFLVNLKLSRERKRLIWTKTCHNKMPQNTILTQELSLSTMIFEISVVEGVIKNSYVAKNQRKMPVGARF